MPTKRRTILAHLTVTTCAALAVTCGYLYLGHRPQSPMRPSPIEHRLDRQISVDFADARLDTVFQTLGRQMGVRIDVDWTTLQACGFDRDHAITLTLRDVRGSRVLDVLMGEMGTAAGPIIFAERDGRIVVSHESALATPVVRLYDVRDLLDEYVAFRTSVPNEQYTVVSRGTIGTFASKHGLSNDPRAEAIEDLSSVLMVIVDPDSWIDNGGRMGHTYYAMQRLVVAQTPENQRQIERILVAMRERGLADYWTPPLRRSDR